MKVLGIETSCDETAAAVVEDGRKILSSVVYSQIEKFKKFSGVIPEMASRMHLEAISEVIDKALNEADASWGDIDLIAVTNGPGLIGSLMVGVNAAKTLAWKYNKPLLPINHLHGHICANFLDSDFAPPFICLLASGGHTQIIKVASYTQMEIVGETIDDAAGEAFDKVARLLELPYPGGPHVDKLAQTFEGKPELKFSIPKVGGYDFSFSGLKTAALRQVEKFKSSGEYEPRKAELAAAFQHTVAQTFLQKISALQQETGIEQVVIAGGVAANSEIRKVFDESFEHLHCPPLKFCTDNAAMIASSGYFNSQEQDLSFDPELLSTSVYSRV